MTSLVPFSVSLVLAAAVGRLSKCEKFNLSWIGYLVTLGLPLSLWFVEGISKAVLGLGVSLAVLSVTRIASSRGSIFDLFGLLFASLVGYWLGFRIQFIQPAFGGNYIYLTWLALPITVAWLYSISKSVEFIHFEIGSHRWKLFTVTMLIITVFFVFLVGLQGDGSLALPLNIGFGFLGVLVGILLISPSKEAFSAIALQFGFILASLAVSGVVKSLTAFVLLVPIAPLVLPTAKRSFSFASAATANVDTNKSLINRLSTELVKSNPLGIFLTYTVLSYLGLVIAWYLWSPGLVPMIALTSSVLLVPGIFLLGRKTVAYFSSWRPSIANRNERAQILGTPFNLTDLSQTTDKVETLAHEKNTSYVATPDVTAVVKAENDEVLRKSFSRADIVTPDGFGLVWASDLHDIRLNDRVAGIDLLEKLFSTTSGLSIYLLGSLPGVARKAGEKISTRYDNVEVVGAHHGYDPIDDMEVVKEINAASPDILLVGMGVPRQERWILHNMERITVNLVMGVGGSFDVISDRLPRAPKGMRNNGLEWLYRIWLEPKRLWKARLIPYFMATVIKEKVVLSVRNEIL